MKNPAWTSEEVGLLAANKHLTNAALAAMLPGRTWMAVKNQRAVQGLPRVAASRRIWTDAQFQFMRDNPQMTDAQMARALSVKLGSLSNARKKAAIRKTYSCVKCGVALGTQGKWCSEHNTAARRWTQYASKAKEKGLEFALTHDELHALLDAPCTYCGGEGGGIDRVDSDKGYVAGNVTGCCWRCNQMKNDQPLADWINRMQQVLKHLGGAQ